jgi:hypothetical protein|tara:strand:- start:36 stop:212 length:177 start_codon:yes stop_codon:yes gene_type:complete
MTFDDLHIHKKALKLEVGILKDRYESTNTPLLHTALHVLEHRIKELDDILVFQGFLES